MLRKTRLLCLLFALSMLFVRAFALDASDYAVSPPDLFIVNGVLIGPVQLTADNLGAKVKLEGKTLTVTRGEVTFTCTINSTAASIGDTPLTLPKAPFLSGDRLYMPIAPLVRAFGGTVTVNTPAGYATVAAASLKDPLHFPLVPLDKWRISKGEVFNALYVINLDGSGLRRIGANIGYIHSPAYSPDGAYLIYIRNENIYLRHVQQADEICLLTAKDDILSHPCVTPDGKYILYQQRLVTGLKTENRYRIWRMKPDGSEKRMLGVGTYNSVSQDSRTIAYTMENGGKTEMRLMDIDGGQQRSLGTGNNPVIAPDGVNLLYSKSFDVEKKAIDLLVPRPLAGTPTAAVPAPPKETPSESEAQFSSDGKQIVYRGKGLAIMGADRGGVTQLTTGAFDKSPIFTSDGQQIVFLRGNGSPLSFMDEEDEEDEYYLDYSLVSIRPNGADEMDIYEDMDVREFAVAPDGRQIVFVGDAEPPKENQNDQMKEAEPAYTLEDAQRYVAELVPMIEEVAGRKFTTVPEVRLVKRRELVPVMAQEIAPQLRGLFGNDAIDVNSFARLSAKGSAPAVLGKYGVKDHILYLLPGNIDALERVVKISPMHREGLIKLIIAHELTHALEDQHVDLAGQIAKATTAEKVLALSATHEGYAVYVQDGVAEKLKANSTAREMARMLAIAITPSPPTTFLGQNGSLQTFREVYLGGRDFIDWHIQKQGMDTAWQILANPPVKTRMILHPELYGNAVEPGLDYAPIMRETALRLGIQKAKMMTLELGEITMREFFAVIDASERDKLTAGIDQIYMSAGLTEEADPLMLMLVTFQNQEQMAPFVKVIEEQTHRQFDGRISGDKQGPLAGITADYTHKRIIAAGEHKETIVSAVRGKLLLLIDLENTSLTDTELAAMLEDAFKRIDALKAPAAPANPE